MGQSQSTGSKGPGDHEAQPERKTDYYELLDVTRGASDDEYAPIPSNEREKEGKSRGGGVY